MSDLFSRYSPLSGSSERTFFAGANTADGFISAYPQFIREKELDRLYIIKGGSGTGKSSLMKACAVNAEKAGAELTVLLCSSDPSSADAVLLRGKNGRTAALLDGTAPHITDPALPGAVSEIVNMGRYWDAEKLRSERAEIAEHTAQKKDAFVRLYRFLGGYRYISEVQSELLRPCLLADKMAAAAERIITSFPSTKKPCRNSRYTFALSMSGACHLSTFTAAAERELCVLDHYGSGEFFLKALVTAADQRNTALTEVPSPVCPDVLSELWFPSLKTSVTLAKEKAEANPENRRTVNMQRFLDRRQLSLCRGKIRFAERCRESLFDGALSALEEAREHHFALENIYRTAMDFSSAAAETERISRELTELFC